MIIPLIQGSAEWHDWRAGGIGASDVSAVISSPYAMKTARALWMIRSGRKPADNLSRNPFVLRGQRLEPYARAAIEQYLESVIGVRDFAIPMCLQHDEHEFIRVSLDGMLSTGEPTELKVPSWENFELVLKEGRNSVLYNRYVPQVQDQMLCTGADHGYLAFYRYLDNKLAVFEIKRDQSFIDMLVEKQAWWWDLYNRDEAPPITPLDFYEPETPQEQSEWVEIALELQTIWQELSVVSPKVQQMKEKESLLKSKLNNLMGDHAKAEYAGVRISNSPRLGNVDWQRYLSDIKSLLLSKGVNIQLPEPEQYRKKATETVRISRVEYKGDGEATVMHVNFA
jgi:putative phage-type endonuclease